MTLSDRIEELSGTRPAALEPLPGGCVGEVYRVRMAAGGDLVAKVSDGADDALSVEGWMLSYLDKHSDLPVPQVVHADDRLLLMAYIDSGDPLTASAQEHAAELLAALHGVTADRYGLERDTVIGGLRQPNDPSESWIDFFRDRRLIHMAREALAVGALNPAMMDRIETFAGSLEDLLGPSAPPGLIHGDMWGGNVLVRGGRIAGFVDPAIYFADPEIELAFSTLFSTYGKPFFARYGEIRPLRPGFWEQRRDIYNLYPLLVHARLFGAGYAREVDNTLRRFGG